jgi:hypothetical protein
MNATYSSCLPDAGILLRGMILLSTGLLLPIGPPAQLNESA